MSNLKVLVCAKRVVDANVRVRVKDDNSDVEIEHAKMSLNPFDENAIEEAVKLKEKGHVSEIIAISIGSEKCNDTLRTAIARGADRAIRVNSVDRLDSIIVAKVLKKIIEKEQPDIILMGKQAIDDDANQAGQMLAGMLNYPQGTFISKLEVNADKSVTVTREIENGTEMLNIQLPAVLTADLHLNEPRFIKLPQLMMAKKKTIETVELSDINVTVNETYRIVSARDGEIKKQCKIINNVDEIIDILKQKKVI